MAGRDQHRETVRQKIIQSALQLFNRHGFTGVSIDDIMAGAGLTRGGFYSYFQSKSELYAEAISCFVTEKREVIASADGASERAVKLLRDYLSREHFEDLETSCPLIGLPNGVSRADRLVREAQQVALKMMVSTFEQGMASEDEETSNAQPSRQVALALTSLCLGGMVLARAIEDRVLAGELREATMSVAMTT